MYANKICKYEMYKNKRKKLTKENIKQYRHADYCNPVQLVI